MVDGVGKIIGLKSESVTLKEGWGKVLGEGFKPHLMCKCSLDKSTSRNPC